MLFFLIMSRQEDDKEEQVRKIQQRRIYHLRLNSGNEEVVPRLDLVDAWNSKIASVFTTWNGRDRIEAAKVIIAVSKTEEERAHHQCKLKRSWPGAQIYGTSAGEPEWDKRDLAGLTFRGNPEEQNEGLDHSPDYTFLRVYQPATLQ